MVKYWIILHLLPFVFHPSFVATNTIIEDSRIRASGTAVEGSTLSTSSIDNADILLKIRKNAIGSCTVHINAIPDTNNIDHKISLHKKSMFISLFPPSSSEITRYNNVPNTLTRANPSLAEGKVMGNSRVEAWFKSGNNWQLPADHPRNNKTRCFDASLIAGKEVSSFYKEMKNETSLFYLIHTDNALVHGTGIVAKECGYIQAHESCETIFKFLGKKWYKTCQTGIVDLKIPWKSVWDGTNESVTRLLSACPEPHEKYSTPIKRHKRVFVITAGWDSNYHHFMLDSLTRLIRHLDFLLANPDVMIHIRAVEQTFKKQDYVVAGRELRARLFAMVGIDMSRVISGQIYADELFLPKSTPCNAPLSIAYELRELVRLFFTKSYPESREFLKGYPESGIYGPGSIIQAAAFANKTLAIQLEKKNIIIQHRPCYTQKDCDKNWRVWDNSTVQAMERELRERFPNHNVMTINSHNSYWTNCMTCQIRTYANTDILIGLHGAGLTNIIFMPPNSVVIELAAQFDGRMQPVCGYHGPLAAVFGVHHYIHYDDWKLNLAQRKKGQNTVLIDAHAIALETFSFFNELRGIRGSS